MKGNNGIIGPKQITNLAEGIGKFDLYDCYYKRLDDTWPEIKEATVTVGGISNNTAYEGQSLSFSITTTGVPPNSTLSYNIIATGGAITTSDFTDAIITSNFTVDGSGSATINKTLARESFNEPDDKFIFRVSYNGITIGDSPEITITNPSYSVSSTSSSYDEGTSPTFILTWSNVYPGFHYWTMSGSAANTNDFTITSNSFYISSYSGTTTLSPSSIINDYLTEGTESIYFYIRVNNIFSYIVASTYIEINDTSITPSATITPSVSSINEGASVSFSIATTNFPSGTLNWDVILSADMEYSDIDVTSGTVTISSSTGSVSITATSDGYTETGQTEEFQLRVYAPDGTTVIGTSSAVTINDTSTGSPEPTGPTPIDVTTSFYEISDRFISSDTYMGNTADYNGPYDVTEVCTNFSGVGRIYLGIKVTASTTFYNDICIAGVQILDNSQSSLLASWIFYDFAGGSGNSWQTSYLRYNGSSSTGFTLTPATASTQSYVNISTGTGVDRFTWASSTSSSYTGCLDGISSSYTTNILPLGTAAVIQSTNAYYAYRETSGSTLYSETVMRSPTYNFTGNEVIRVAHAVAGYSAVPMDANDSLYIAVY